MPVDAIQPYQIIIMVTFLLLLISALFFVRRFRGGLSKHIHRTKRMQYIEDMSLTPHQRLYLIEVDGQPFMIHGGKGHAATVVRVDASSATGSSSAAEPPMTLMDIQKATPKHQNISKDPATSLTSTTPSITSSANQQSSKANVDEIASAIAEARRRNPSLGLGK